MLEEFKKFISKGNVVEMAVGLIMAVYFGAIVKSLVDKLQGKIAFRTGPLGTEFQVYLPK